MKVAGRWLGIGVAGLLLAAAGGLVLALRDGAPSAPSAPPAASSPAQVVADEPLEPAADATGAPAASDARLVAAQRAVANARAERASARSELADAEAEMEDVERSVEELERFVADLKARGEDPTEHVDEGVAMFRPALEHYRSTATRIELAQKALHAAEADLAEAEGTLAALREELGGGAPGATAD